MFPVAAPEKECYFLSMKRKLHPHRRHGRRHISAKLRCELAGELIVLSRRKARESGVPLASGHKRSENPFPAFPRARRARRGRITLPRLVAAGYRVASLERHQDWQDAHAFLRARCTHTFWLTYTWFGGTFVFENPDDHLAFTQAFACADGYKPMFAFESGR